MLGRPASRGDEVQAPDGHVFVVEEMDGLRVARVRVEPKGAGTSVAHASEPQVQGARQV